MSSIFVANDFVTDRLRAGVSPAAAADVAQ